MEPGAAQVLTHSPAFYAGALLVALYQSSSFAQLGRADAIAGRYVTALGGVQASDLTGKINYWIGLVSFVLASLLIYGVLCLFPGVVQGLAKVFNVPLKETFFQSSETAPLYMAILMVGLAQPILPVIPKLFDALRILFQDMTNIPYGFDEQINEWTELIRSRSGTSKTRLKDEIENLVDPSWSDFRKNSDYNFFSTRYQSILNGRDLDDMSRQDLLILVENILVIAGVALLRKSGPKFDVIRNRLDAPPPAPPKPSEIGYLWGSVLLFLFLTIIVWQLTASLDTPVSYITLKDPKGDFWPDDTEYALKDVLLRIPNALLPLLLTMYLWRRSFAAKPALPAPRLSFLSLGGYLDNLSAYSRILLWCIPFGILIGGIVGLYGYAISSVKPNLDGVFFERKLMVLLLQSLVPLPACYALIVTLEAGKARQRKQLGAASLFVALSVALLAIVYAQTHLRIDLLRAYGDLAPGTEYVLLTVFTSVSLLLGAFLCIAIYVQRSDLTLAEAARPLPAAVPGGH